MDSFKYLSTSLKRLFCITIFTTSVCAHIHRCPPTVQKSRFFKATFNSTCYLFVDMEKFWGEARQYCWQMGGEMLYVKNQETMDFIKRVLHSPELGWSNNGVWNGASDLRKRGWEWTTGEPLRYKYWADGEPGSLWGLGIISLENCACMRRSDDWRWHDYHCSLDGFEYNFICQFPFVPTHTIVTANKGAPLEVERQSDDRVVVICLAVAGFILVSILFGVSFLLYRKHERQKASVVTSTVRFRNTGYATIMRDPERNIHANRLAASRVSTNTDSTGRIDRPVSNIYLEPREVTRIYEEVNKDTNHGVNSLASHGESAPLMFRGGAGAIDDGDSGALSNSPSVTSGATSGYCSGTLDRRVDDSEYIEMTGDQSMGSISSHTATSGPNGGNVVSQMKSDGATGKGTYQNSSKCSNLYVTPSTCANNTSGNVNKDNGCNVDKKPCNLEMHIYTNQTEQAEFDNINLRPLPPVPGL